MTKIIDFITHIILFFTTSKKLRKKIETNIRKDLQRHFVGCLCGVIVVALILVFFMPVFQAVWISVLSVATLLSVYKEFIIAKLLKKGVFGWDDIVANFLGSLAGGIIFYGVYWILKFGEII